MENINCLVIGDNFVGKTSLIHRMTDNIYFNDYTPTKFNLYQKNLIYKYKPLSITFMELSQQNIDFYSKIDIFILCFSLDINKSTLNIFYTWINEINLQKPIIFVRTKSDLLFNNNSKLFNSLLKKNILHFYDSYYSTVILENIIETSAKKYYNIEKLLDTICEYYFKYVKKKKFCTIM